MVHSYPTLLISLEQSDHTVLEVLFTIQDFNRFSENTSIDNDESDKGVNKLS